MYVNLPGGGMPNRLVICPNHSRIQSWQSRLLYTIVGTQGRRLIRT
jgi:hypothetical protein